MGATLWAFLMLPDGGVDRYSFRRYEKLFDRTIPLGAAVGGEARFVELAVETRKGLIARQRYRLEHSWQPRPSQLRSIVDAVNHHAAKDLVKTDGRRLLPI